jgi:hypothetical protein
MSCRPKATPPSPPRLEKCPAGVPTLDLMLSGKGYLAKADPPAVWGSELQPHSPAWIANGPPYGVCTP